MDNNQWIVNYHPSQFKFCQQNWQQNGWPFQSKWIQLSSKFWTNPPISSMNMLQHHGPWSVSQYHPIFRLSTPFKCFLRFLGTTNWHKRYISAGFENFGRLGNTCIHWMPPTLSLSLSTCDFISYLLPTSYDQNIPKTNFDIMHGGISPTIYYPPLPPQQVATAR